MTAWQVTGVLVAVVVLLALYDAGRDLVTRRRSGAARDDVSPFA